MNDAASKTKNSDTLQKGEQNSTVEDNADTANEEGGKQSEPQITDGGSREQEQQKFAVGRMQRGFNDSARTVLFSGNERRFLGSREVFIELCGRRQRIFQVFKRKSQIKLSAAQGLVCGESGVEEYSRSYSDVGKEFFAWRWNVN